MKLRNKKTGEIKEIEPFVIGGYRSLAELNEEWEDYEDGEYYYAITSIKADDGITKMKNKHNDMTAFDKSIGNYFLSREEAEKAVEKLKAFKRLKEQIIDHILKYEFDELTEDIHANISFSIERYPSVGKDLDLLFGGEE